ncbi:MAG TPA: DoxX family protein [Gemmatimonadaceae bacterium]|nr:DoxX family protein [Gemmatimonadaceae bacterium]
MSPSIRYGLLPLLARVLLISEFVVALNGKIFGWSGQAAYMAAKGMTFITPLLAAALAIELIGSLMLITGFRARAAAAVMFVYLGIVSVRLHAFWAETGNAAGMNVGQFFKNLGMMGGLLMIAVYGAGAWSIDARRAKSDPSVAGVNR